jgi:hypothetical protein
MKTKACFIAALVGLAFDPGAPAHAVALNPKGLGQFLIYPYYTANKNQDTLVTLVNTADTGKVVRGRFLEGYNGRYVMEVFLFLSPHDVWSARVGRAADDGVARLFSNDNSCVYPRTDSNGHDIRVNGIPFSPSAYAGGSTFPPDGGPTMAARTTEGHFEFAAAGEIIPGSPTDQSVVHVQNGTPNGGFPTDCPSPNGRWTLDTTTPTNTLAGSAAIVNVGEGTFFSYNAEALSGFTSVPMTGDYDGLRKANSQGSQYPSGAIAVTTIGERAPTTLDYLRGIDAVNAVLMADAINNDYLVDSSLGANTDWVLTFPTKAFHVDEYYATQGAIPPFTELFGQKTPGQSNVLFDLDIYDHEEGAAANACAPGACSKYALPYEVNVVSFAAEPAADQRSQVLGSALATYVTPYGNSGWAQMNLNPEREPHLLREGTTAAGASVVLEGLPVVGFMVYNVINSNAQPGKLANYSGLFPHRATTSCSSNAKPPLEDPCS